MWDRRYMVWQNLFAILMNKKQRKSDFRHKFFGRRSKNVWIIYVILLIWMYTMFVYAKLSKATSMD